LVVVEDRREESTLWFLIAALPGIHPEQLAGGNDFLAIDTSTALSSLPEEAL
jgi:hypothetical protein